MPKKSDTITLAEIEIEFGVFPLNARVLNRMAAMGWFQRSTPSGHTSLWNRNVISRFLDTPEAREVFKQRHDQLSAELHGDRT